MSERSIIINLSEAAVVSCLEFSPQSTTIEDAVTKTLEGFTSELRKAGQVNTFTADETAFILKNFIDQHSEPDDSDMAFQRIAEQAAQTIEATSTADIAQKLELREKVEHVISAPPFNVFEQRRDTFETIKLRAPLDPLVVKTVEHITKEYKPGEVFNLDDQIALAALEIVYTYFPRDLWGTDKAILQISNLVAMHKGAQNGTT